MSRSKSINYCQYEQPPGFVEAVHIHNSGNIYVQLYMHTTPVFHYDCCLAFVPDHKLKARI
jgi:hypothetical protein